MDVFDIRMPGVDPGTVLVTVDTHGNITTIGSVTATGGVTATGALTAASLTTTGNVTAAGLQVKSGTNARIGQLTLTGATPVVVGNTSVTANTVILTAVHTVGGTPAFHWVSARVAGTSFSVTGTAGDTSVLDYVLIEPA